jgi:hypothetical protein
VIWMSVMRKWFIPIAIAAASMPVASETGGIAGPVAGFVFDRRAAVLRPIEGLPGAARLGAPIPMPFAVGLAAVRGDYALVGPAAGGAAVLARRFRASAPEIVDLPGAVEPSAMSIAGSGAVAILFSASAHRVQFVDGLPDAPRALDPVDTELIGDLAAIALDAAGTGALLAGPDGQIYRLRKDSPSLVPIARLNGVSSIGFVPGRDSALAASRETGDVLLLDGLDEALSIRSIGGAAAGIASARAVLALDGRTAGVIAGDGRLAAIDFETGAAEWIALAADAEAFVPVDRSLFALNRAGEGPLVLLDSNGRSAWFVPPIRPALRPRGHEKDLIRAEDRPD